MQWIFHKACKFYLLAELNQHDLQEEKIAELLLRVSLGEEPAFTQLVNLYWNKVYSHALAYVKSSHRAQEIVQDVFLKVWNRREALAEVRDFKSYLFILGRNHILASMRKKVLEVASDDPGDIAEDALQPDHQLHFKEAYHLLLKGIEELPPTRKAVFKMSRLEGLTHDEIAQALRISKSTVKGHIVLALNFLRTYIRSHSDSLPTVLTLAFLLGEKLN